MSNPREAAEALADGCEHVETVAELEARLAGMSSKAGTPYSEHLAEITAAAVETWPSDKPLKRLRVKLGLDPTSPDLHIGHAVVLRKLQDFVEQAHDVTLLIGDFTARIGDPSGRNILRPPLSEEAIAANMQTYAAQAGKVLDMEQVELRYNSEWLGVLRLDELIRLLSQTTVARMLDRNDFAQRYAAGTPISLHEFLYPVAQAYDSVALSADVELGGSDQLFNLLMGRTYQERAGQPPQICMTVPLLEGLDGVVKMSKSVGNHIGLTESAQDQFGKVMRIPDELIPRYARLAVFRSQPEVEALKQALRDGRALPMDEKKKIAQELVALYHGHDAARAARENFERTVQRRELPEEMPEVRTAQARKLVDVIVLAGFAQSKREAERLIAGGGVKLDGSVITDTATPWAPKDGAVLSVGARKHARLVP
ncbi:MAG TPA: tyrosine--tRNA ligase [Candidatus Acidoferrales bacterium]|nr:tyrosine--tRNA ligase [Candidatus Acidoferrales bacterium]